MIIFERLGGWGLGNSLFQIATTVGIAKNNNTDFFFPSDCAFRKNRYNPINTMFKYELPWINISSLNNNFRRWGTGEIGYFEPPSFTENTIIDGFFQSEKYFQHARSELLELFSLRDDIKKN